MPTTVLRTFRRPVTPTALLVVWLLSAIPAQAQLPQTRLNAVSPPGGQAGSTFDLKVSSGTDIDELDRLLFSHKGITATQKMNGTGDAATPVANTFTVTIADSVPAGHYEVRAGGLFGVSNPRCFVVGTSTELAEKEPNNTHEQAMPLELEQTVNSLSNSAADVDIYKFSGTAGQRVFIRCLATDIDSRLRPTLELFNASGRLLSFARHNPQRDPLLDYQITTDGDYFVRVTDLVYAGGAEYFYRLQITQAPQIDFVLPSGGVPGTKSSFTLYGRSLPGGQPAGISIDGHPLEKLTVDIALPNAAGTVVPGVRLDSVQAGIDGFAWSLNSPQGPSNPVLIQFSSAPVALEQEPNDTADKSGPLTVPGEVSGQFQQRGDIDWYTFEAKKGNVYFIEVFGERGGSSADPIFTVEQVQKKDDGTETVRVLTTADDTATNLAALEFDTYTADPVYRFQVPADGEYRISVRDRYYESRGDARLVYRLAVREETPDFRVVAVPFAPAVNNARAAGPSSITLRKGDTAAVNVLAFRQDGFTGPIRVTAENLPAGVTTPGVEIGEKQTSATLIFTSAEDAAPWTGTVSLKAVAVVEDPVKARAVVSTRNVIKPAKEALPKLADAVQKATAAHTPLAAQAEKAAAAAAKDPENKGLATAAAQAKQKADAAAKALETAKAALAAGENKLAAAVAAAEAAVKANTAAAREVSHPVRAGTVLYPLVANTPPSSRLAQTLTMCIVDEVAPFQLTTPSEVLEFDAGQNYQVLVPVKLTRRNGFDAQVAVTVTGLPNNSQIQVQQAPIKKGEDTGLYRLFVNGNAPEATYSLYLSGTAPVSYSRNPAAAERAKKKAEAAAAALKAAQEVLQKANAERDAAVKQATATDAAVKQVTAEVAKAKTAQQQAAAAAKQAEEEKKKTDADAAADDAKKQAAAKKLEEATAAAKTADEAVTAAEKKLAEAQAAAKTAAEAKTSTEAAAKAADAAVKTADTAKKAADKASAAAATAAKAKNTNVMVAAVPLLIRVRKAPVTLTAAVPDGGKLKKGQSLEIKVTVKRQNDFDGPVKLTLPSISGVSGLSAAEVTIPADATEGVLKVAAAGDATEGQLANVVIRATGELQGTPVSVDAPVKLNVTK